MTALVLATCAILVLGAQETKAVCRPADATAGFEQPSRVVRSDVEPQGKPKGKKLETVPIPKKPKPKPVTLVDYYQPAFREPLELVALAKSLLSDEVVLAVEPEAKRLRLESRSKERLADTLALLRFLDRSYLEFSVEIAYTYMDSLERLGYYGEFDMVSGGVFCGPVRKREIDAKVLTTAYEKKQVFTVLENHSVDVHTGRTQIDLAPKEVYVADGQPIVRAEMYEQYCGFHMSLRLEPAGPVLSIDPFCHIVSGTEQKPGFEGPVVSIPVRLNERVALFTSDDPVYPQAQRLSTAIFMWARNRLERRPVLVFKVGIRGLDEIAKGGER